MGLKLSDLFVKLRLDNKQYNSELKESGKKTSMFGDGVKKIGGLIAGAFAVSQVVAFGRELLELGGVAEGVRSAFNRMADDQVLRDLQDATKGTVSELELMKRAVSARNLGLPIENLASLFQFATKRAQETGESVDFLVNSIVTGIGRKSPLILDNLGISAIQLREKLNGVGMESASVAEVAAAVGEIAADSMRESGEVIETNAIKVDQLKTAWIDFKEELAKDEEFKKASGAVIDGLKREIKLLPQELKTSMRALRFVFGKQIKDGLDGLQQVGTQAEENAKKINTVFQTALIGLGFAGGLTKDINKETKLTFEEWEKIGDKIRFANERAEDIEMSFLRMSRNLQKMAESSDEFFEKWTAPADLGGIFSDSPLSMPDEADEDIDFDTAAYLARERAAQEFVDNMNDIMSSGMADFVSTFAEGIGRLASGDIGIEEFGAIVLQQVGGFLKIFGEALIAYGIASEAFKKAFANPVVAIAAGAALVAIGGFLGGMGSKGPQGFSGGGGSSVSGNSFNVVTTNAQDQQLVTKVTGRDLDFVLTKYNSDRSRR